MALERTLSIIKPDVVSRDLIGKVIARFEKADLHIAAIKMAHLSRVQAEEFYAIHKGRPFYDELVTFMSSAPVVIQVLEGEEAIKRNRQLMGATDPKAAAPGTIRADFGASVSTNAVHGSDAAETAEEEIKFFFTPEEIISRG
ncbi:MAG: nucleoside-diphosphate kinase [Gammaproteobacteria bacterium]|nr:nucleoside-diphosphate kinase [Gammaproteobacteria bacterium]